MFRFLKFGVGMFFGMLIAPKNGTEFRDDLAEYLKKFRPQLQKIIYTIEESWSKAQDNKTEEIGANIEYKINKLNNVVKNKEITPYSTLKKVGNVGSTVFGELKKSDNARRITRELAKVGIALIEGVTSVSKKVNDISKNVAVEASPISKNKKTTKKIEVKD